MGLSPMNWPLRKTVTSSAIANISLMRWVTIMSALPTALQPLISSNSRLTWRPSRLAVASSRIKSSGSLLYAFRISTICRSSGGRSLIAVAGESLELTTPSNRARSSTLLARTKDLSMRPDRPIGSLPSHKLASTDRSGHKAQFLIGRCYTIFACNRRRAQRDGVALPSRGSRVGSDEAGENLGQSRLAGAVCSSKSADVTCLDRERNIMKRDCRPIMFANLARSKKGRWLWLLRAQSAQLAAYWKKPRS